MSEEEPVVLPNWWKRPQRVKNTIIYYAILAGIGLAAVLPYWFLATLGRCLGALGFVFAWSDRRRAIRQLRTAMPELAHPRRVVFRMFVHLGALGAEWVKIDRFALKDSRYLEFDAASQKVLADALAEGRGVLFVAPHLGNWELLAQASTRRGFPCSSIAKETYDPRITRLLARFRARAGVLSLWRGDPQIMRKLQATLREGRLLGALIDQDTKVPSVMVPFFGRPASTPVVPQLLAVRYKAAVVFGYAVREGRRYRVHCERVPLPESGGDKGDRKQDAVRLTADLTARIEAVVRRYPWQWVWLHARWKRSVGALS